MCEKARAHVKKSIVSHRAVHVCVCDCGVVAAAAAAVAPYQKNERTVVNLWTILYFIINLYIQILHFIFQ